MADYYAIALSCLTPTYSSTTPTIRKIQYDANELTDGTSEECSHAHLLFHPKRPWLLSAPPHSTAHGNADDGDKSDDENDDDKDQPGTTRNNRLSNAEDVNREFGPYVGQLLRNDHNDCFDQVAAYAGGKAPTKAHTDAVRNSLGLTTGTLATSDMQIKIARHYDLGLIVIDLLDQRIKHCYTGDEPCIVYLRQQDCHASPFCQGGNLERANRTYTASDISELLDALELIMTWTEVTPKEAGGGDTTSMEVDEHQSAAPSFPDVAGDSSPVLRVQDHTMMTPLPVDAYPAGEYRVVEYRVRSHSKTPSKLPGIYFFAKPLAATLGERDQWPSGNRPAEEWWALTSSLHAALSIWYEDCMMQHPPTFRGPDSCAELLPGCSISMFPCNASFSGTQHPWPSCSGQLCPYTDIGFQRYLTQVRREQLEDTSADGDNSPSARWARSSSRPQAKAPLPQASEEPIISVAHAANLRLAASLREMLTLSPEPDVHMLKWLEIGENLPPSAWEVNRVNPERSEFSFTTSPGGPTVEWLQAHPGEAPTLSLTSRMLAVRQWLHGPPDQAQALPSTPQFRSYVRTWYMAGHILGQAQPLVLVPAKAWADAKLMFIEKHALAAMVNGPPSSYEPSTTAPFACASGPRLKETSLLPSDQEHGRDGSTEPAQAHSQMASGSLKRPASTEPQDVSPEYSPSEYSPSEEKGGPPSWLSPRPPSSAPGARNVPSSHDENDLCSHAEHSAATGYTGRRKTMNPGDIDFAGARDPSLHSARDPRHEPKRVSQPRVPPGPEEVDLKTRRSVHDVLEGADLKAWENVYGRAEDEIWDDPRHPPPQPLALNDFFHSFRRALRTGLITLYRSQGLLLTTHAYGGHALRLNALPNMSSFKTRKAHQFFSRPEEYSSHLEGLLHHQLGKAALWIRIQIGTGPDPGTKSKPGEDEPARFEVSRTSHPLAGPTHIREAGVIVRHALTNMLSLVEPGYTQDLKIAALARSVARDLQYSKSRADEDDEAEDVSDEANDVSDGAGDHAPSLTTSPHPPRGGIASAPRSHRYWVVLQPTGMLSSMLTCHPGIYFEPFGQPFTSRDEWGANFESFTELVLALDFWYKGPLKSFRPMYRGPSSSEFYGTQFHTEQKIDQDVISPDHQRHMALTPSPEFRLAVLRVTTATLTRCPQTDKTRSDCFDQVLSAAILGERLLSGPGEPSDGPTLCVQDLAARRAYWDIPVGILADETIQIRLAAYEGVGLCVIDLMNNWVVHMTRSYDPSRKLLVYVRTQEAHADRFEPYGHSELFTIAELRQWFDSEDLYPHWVVINEKKATINHNSPFYPRGQDGDTLAPVGADATHSLIGEPAGTDDSGDTNWHGLREVSTPTCGSTRSQFEALTAAGLAGTMDVESFIGLDFFITVGLDGDDAPVTARFTCGSVSNTMSLQQCYDLLCLEVFDLIVDGEVSTIDWRVIVSATPAALTTPAADRSDTRPDGRHIRPLERQEVPTPGQVSWLDYQEEGSYEPFVDLFRTLSPDAVSVLLPTTLTDAATHGNLCATALAALHDLYTTESVRLALEDPKVITGGQVRQNLSMIRHRQSTLLLELHYTTIAMPRLLRQAFAAYHNHVLRRHSKARQLANFQDQQDFRNGAATVTQVRAASAFDSRRRSQRPSPSRSGFRGMAPAAAATPENLGDSPPVPQPRTDTSALRTPAPTAAPLTSAPTKSSEPLIWGNLATATKPTEGDTSSRLFDTKSQDSDTSARLFGAKPPSMYSFTEGPSLAHSPAKSGKLPVAPLPLMGGRPLGADQTTCRPSPGPLPPVPNPSTLKWPSVNPTGDAGATGYRFSTTATRAEMEEGMAAITSDAMAAMSKSLSDDNTKRAAALNVALEEENTRGLALHVAALVEENDRHAVALKASNLETLAKMEGMMNAKMEGVVHMLTESFASLKPTVGRVGSVKLTAGSAPRANVGSLGAATPANAPHRRTSIVTRHAPTAAEIRELHVGRRQDEGELSLLPPSDSSGTSLHSTTLHITSRGESLW